MATDKAKNRAKTLYNELKFTQRRMAANIGITPAAMKKMINQDDSNMTVEDIDKICSSMGLSLFDFFNSSDFYPANAHDKPFKKDLTGLFHERRINRRYEIVEYDHAGDILKCYPDEFSDIKKVLRNLNITMSDVIKDGGNESSIPKKIRDEFLACGWIVEQQIGGALQVDLSKKTNAGIKTKELYTVSGYLTGYQIDYFKNGIAVDTEWNSKDQTFDRDLTAMRAYYEAGLISMGIIITRGSELCTFPKRYGKLRKKYGASTTWLNQLTERLDSRRAGGCPILAIGITPNVITDYKPD